MDQLIARKYGQDTILESIQLGVEEDGNFGNCNWGYSCAYSNSVSWSSPTQPLPKEVNPKMVFERLFGGTDAKARERRQASRKSVLDFIRDDSKSLNTKLGKSDQQKLDEYLESVRDVEQRIARAGQQGEVQGWRPTLDQPNIPRPPEGMPQNIRISPDGKVFYVDPKKGDSRVLRRDQNQRVADKRVPRCAID